MIATYIHRVPLMFPSAHMHFFICLYNLLIQELICCFFLSGSQYFLFIPFQVQSTQWIHYHHSSLQIWEIGLDTFVGKGKALFQSKKNS